MHSSKFITWILLLYLLEFSITAPLFETLFLVSHLRSFDSVHFWLILPWNSCGGVHMTSKLLLVAVFVLDLIAFALAVAAEQRRSSATLRNDGTMRYCVYEKDIATGLGVGSLLLLLASQILIMVATRCLCCGHALHPGRSRVWAIVLFITSWITFFIAEECLLAGSVRNAYHTKYKAYLSQHPPSCETLRKGIFGAAAAFIVFTGTLSELFYVSYSRSDHGLKPGSREPGIRMGSI